jgi:hypothetical protein
VLLWKGFEPGVVHRLIQLVLGGGAAAINIKGVVGVYFRYEGSALGRSTLSHHVLYGGGAIAMILEPLVGTAPSVPACNGL